MRYFLQTPINEKNYGGIVKNHEVDCDLFMHYMYACELLGTYPSCYVATQINDEDLHIPLIDIDGNSKFEVSSLIPHTTYVTPTTAWTSMNPILCCTPDHNEPGSVIIEKLIKVLRKLNISYIIYNSSPDSYWVFVDKVSSADSAVNFANTLNFGDSRYIKYTNLRKIFMVRAFPKKMFLPTVYEKFDNKNMSKEFVQYMKEFQNHWTSIKIGQVISLQFVNAIKEKEKEN